jgi:hypothetical protein
LTFLGPCSSGTDAGNYAIFAARGADFGGLGTDFDGAYGEITAQYVQACYPATNLVGSALIPVNVQRTSGSCASVPCIVQAGIMECSAPSGYTCNGIPNDAHVHFFYNCADNDAKPCLADGWFGATPVLGHRYAFQVAMVSFNWQYAIKDLTANSPWKYKTVTIVHWSTGGGAWWGGENHNEWSMLGPGSTASDVWLHALEYHRVSTGWVSINPTIHKDAVNENSGQTLGWPTWYIGQLAEWSNPNDTLNFWTNAH